MDPLILANFTQWISDTDCSHIQQYNLSQNCDDVPVTQSMVNFLNLTTAGLSIFKQAYCVNPPEDDSCPFGYCPNADVAGPLVRIAAYVTNFFLSILIFYAPESAREAFWSQILSIYSLLITVAISIAQASLTQYHAALATVIVGSPLTFYLIMYSIVSFFQKGHRLEDLLGHGQLFARCVVISAGLFWIGLLIRIVVSKHLVHFSQRSCDMQPGQPPLAKYLYIFPFQSLTHFFDDTPWLIIAVFGIIFLTIISWIIAIILQRKAIWPPGEKWTPQIRRTWVIVGRNYSFIHFMSIVVIPTSYWISVIEIGSWVANSDQEFSLSYGQVLAVFVAVPPVFETIKLLPQLADWFLYLTWVRRITGRPSRRKSTQKTDLPINAATASHDDTESSWKSVAASSNYSTSDLPKLDYTYAQVPKVERY
ncbi:hypothetical protein QCA50_013301 [Cerrena zonata]|uniref:Uncharacterized protein n=1 Tax=Cerrena zonata TaxID=2478898 RepID=A0AAW0FTN9_9APHY